MASLSFYDGTTLGFLGAVEFGAYPGFIAVHPKTPIVYVVDTVDKYARAEAWMVVVDSRSRTIISRIPLGRGPTTAALSPDGSRLYVTNQGSDSVTIIDTQSNQVRGTISGIASPTMIAAHPAGGYVYVAGLDGALTVIDTSNDALGDRFLIAKEADSITLSPDGHLAYVSGSSCDHGDYPTDILVVDTSDGRVVRIFEENDGEMSAGYFALAANGRFAIKSGQDLTPPVLIDLSTGTSEYIDCGLTDQSCEGGSINDPGTAAVWEPSNRAYAGGYVIDLRARRVVGTLPARTIAVGACVAESTSVDAENADGCTIARGASGRRAAMLALGVIVFWIIRERPNQRMHATRSEARA